VITIGTVLLVCALVCLLLAAFNVRSPVGLFPLGMAFWLITELIGHVRL
jgi:hypothetical protein